MARILTRCAETSQIVATQAAATERSFARMRTGLTFWCSVCKSAHMPGRDELWLEGQQEMIIHKSRPSWLDRPRR